MDIISTTEVPKMTLSVNAIAEVSIPLKCRRHSGSCILQVNLNYLLNNFVVYGAMKFILGMDISWGSGDQWHTLLPW